MWPNPQFPADLVTFTEEILNRKLPIFVRCKIRASNTSVQKRIDSFSNAGNKFNKRISKDKALMWEMETYKVGNIRNHNYD